ncbi:MAG: flagellar biosynthetic protein FliR [Gemmatimonadales bacterium]
MDLFGMFAPGNWPAFVLISARVTGLVMLAPFWSLLAIPRSSKAAAIVVIAGVLVPGVPRPDFPAEVIAMPAPLLMEFTIGLALGLAATVVTQSLTMASEVVSLQTGLSLGQVLTPNLDLGGPPVAQIYGLLGIAVFVGIGGPVMMLDGLAASLGQYPPGVPLPFGGGATALLEVTGRLFAYAVQVAAPVMAALSVTNIAMAILSRAVPQLNAMAMSFAVTLGVGLLILGASLPLMVRLTTRWLEAAPTAAGALVGAMTGTAP